MRQIHNLPSNHRLDAAVHEFSGEAVHARVLIGQGGADPRLSVARHHLELEVRALLLHQGHGFPQLVHRVCQLLHAVPHGADLAGSHAGGAIELEHGGGGGNGGVEADGEGGAGEELGVSLDGGGVGG